MILVTISSKTSGMQAKWESSKDMFHALNIKSPCFISEVPTRYLAFTHESLLNSRSCICHCYYETNSKPIKTFLVMCSTVSEAIQLRNSVLSSDSYQALAKEHPFCAFCYEPAEYDRALVLDKDHIYVSVPSSQKLKQLIDLVASLVANEGVALQETLKGLQSPQLTFLTHGLRSAEATYYRWRAYSLASGDDIGTYRTVPYTEVKGGYVWHPPSQHSQPLKILTFNQRTYFSKLLAKANRSKAFIEEAMVFAIWNMGCAVEITAMILLQLERRQHGDWLCLLFVLSDILFNSTSLVYRNLFEYVLPTKIARLAQQSRSSADSPINQLRSLLELWQQKFVFEEDFIKGLTVTLDYHLGVIILSENASPTPSQEELSIHQGDCYDYGIPYSLLNPFQRQQLLRIIKQTDQKTKWKQRPDPGAHDGDQITDRDLIKAKTKMCKIITCASLSTTFLQKRP